MAILSVSEFPLPLMVIFTFVERAWCIHDTRRNLRNSPTSFCAKPVNRVAPFLRAACWMLDRKPPGEIVQSSFHIISRNFIHSLDTRHSSVSLPIVEAPCLHIAYSSGECDKHCRQEFMKHVFPRFTRPVFPVPELAIYYRSLSYSRTFWVVTFFT